MLIASLLVVGGVLMIIYTEKIIDFTGRFEFAERWFLGGGTYTFMKLLGLSTTILAFMYLTGGLTSFLNGTIGRLLP